jgi:ATP-dependent protease ClpP protease subunit
MDTASFQADVLPVLADSAALLEHISDLLKSQNSIVLIESEGMYPDLLYAFNKLVRKLPPGNGIDIVLHSHGGTIDAASAIASLCRVRFGSFRIIVPFLAKSAATLLALAADERILTTSAQLGPVDPQVRHPEKGVFFPAHSIKEAMERVEATKDPLVKASMADKLDPFLIGAYQDAIQATKQYIEQVVEGWQVKDKASLISAFTDQYKSHGYPIDCRVLASIGVPYTAIDGQKERLVGDLHEQCIDLLDGDRDEDGAIILTKDEYFFRLGGFKQSGKFSTPVQLSLPTAASKAATTS